MNIGNRSEKGQAVVIVAIVIIALLGITALAIDGGMAFSDRRNAQNAADAAALAGALEKGNLKSNTIAFNTVNASLETNGFDPVNSSATITHHHEPLVGEYYLVTVTLTDTTETYFAQIINQGDLTTVVTAIAKVRVSQPAVDGMAIMAMDKCTNGPLVSFAGGGYDAWITTTNGGIFLNSPESAGHPCTLYLPTSNFSIGIDVEVGHQIWSIGDHNYAGEDKIDPVPIQTGLHGGIRQPDPLAYLPTPSCGSTIGSCDGTTCSPGNINGSEFHSGGLLTTGIYCISGDVKNTIISGPDQYVLLYFEDGGMHITGHDEVIITGPDSTYCSGVTVLPNDPTNLCTYQGLSIFVDRNNDDEIALAGNGEFKIVGSIYHINGTVVGSGGGNAPGDYVVTGQIVAARVESNGQGDFSVYYDAGKVPWVHPQISLVK